jgi:hypothetical protein
MTTFATAAGSSAGDIIAAAAAAATVAAGPRRLRGRGRGCWLHGSWHWCLTAWEQCLLLLLLLLQLLLQGPASLQELLQQQLAIFIFRVNLERCLQVL